MIKQRLRLALAQINPTVGDLAGNLRKIKTYLAQAEAAAADIVAFPELAITGYPPEDLLLKDGFIRDNLAAAQELARRSADTAVVFGFADKKGKHIYNAAGLAFRGKLRAVQHKILLPNYGVFDEKRYFSPGRQPLVLKFGGCLLGLSICEDIWYPDGPLRAQAQMGARLMININGSPYHMGKIEQREKVVRQQARQNRVYIGYVNLVGGQDELVFDGRSLLADDRGRVIARAAAFAEDLLLADIDIEIPAQRSNRKATVIAEAIPPKAGGEIALRKAKALPAEEEVYCALTLGLRDYAWKNGFAKAVIGLSGGIDSALVAALAADALGKENVSGIFMPSRYSSLASAQDASQLAKNLGIGFRAVSIEQIYKIYLLVLEPHFPGLGRDITEENLQARIRGNLLMAFSNKYGWLVLTTGNKSEMATGYATLYGDMAGGLAVIKDVPKTLVYRLARYRNSLGAVIPRRVLVRPPTAELRPHQKDSDTLPPYAALDPILAAYIEKDLAAEEISRQLKQKKFIRRVLAMVDKSEYKRRQSPPGIKITPKAFGRDRRMPITNRYQGY